MFFPRWRKARRQYLTMSSTRWGWAGVSDNLDNTGEGENSSGVPGDALAGDDSRDGSQTAAKDDPKVRTHLRYFLISYTVLMVGDFLKR